MLLLPVFRCSPTSCWLAPLSTLVNLSFWPWSACLFGFREVLPKTTWLRFASYSSASFQHSFYQRWGESRASAFHVLSPPSLNTAALASPRTCWTDSRVRLSISRRSRPTSRFFPGREVSWNTASSRWSSWKVGERRCCYHTTVWNSGLQRGGLTAFFQDATTTTMGRWCPALWGPGSPPSPTPPQRATMENTREREGPPGHGEQYNQECSLVTESQINWLQISKSFSYG